MKLIDTSSWIEQLRKGGDAVTRNRVEVLLETGEAAWCPIVRLKLWNGAQGQHKKKVLREMEGVIPILDIEQEVWDRAVDLSHNSRKAGFTVPATDILVFACANLHNVELEHHDAHFELIDTVDKSSKS